MTKKITAQVAKHYRTLGEKARATKVYRRLQPKEAVIKRLCFITVLITNDWGESGTGFLVTNPRMSRSLLTGKSVAKRAGWVFLVTNKHVIWGMKPNHDYERDSAKEIELQFTKRTADNQFSIETRRISLLNNSSAPRWREHPDLDVDVMAVEVTDVVKDENISTAALYRIHFGDKKALKQHEVKLADEVLILGYPSRLVRHQNNSFPIVRQGMIASDIGTKLEFMDSEGEWSGKAVSAFLVDGAIIPGSSGSPVILKPVYGRIVENRPYKGVIPMLLLGIIAEAIDIPIESGRIKGRTYAGLGIAFGTDTIQETLDLF